MMYIYADLPGIGDIWVGLEKIRIESYEDVDKILRIEGEETIVVQVIKPGALFSIQQVLLAILLTLKKIKSKARTKHMAFLMNLSGAGQIRDAIKKLGVPQPPSIACLIAASRSENALRILAKRISPVAEEDYNCFNQGIDMEKAFSMLTNLAIL